MSRLLASLFLCAVAVVPARTDAFAELLVPPAAAPKIAAVVLRDPSGIELEGSPQFVAATAAALDRLRPLPQFALIRRNLKVIKQFACSGIQARLKTFNVGEETWRSPTIWYAGTIAHDAYHVEKEGPTGLPTADPAGEETACLNFQSGVLAALGDGGAMIRYVEKLAKHPTYQNIGAGKGEFGTGTANDVCRYRRW